MHAEFCVVGKSWLYPDKVCPFFSQISKNNVSLWDGMNVLASMRVKSQTNITTFRKMLNQVDVRKNCSRLFACHGFTAFMRTKR